MNLFSIYIDKKSHVNKTWLSKKSNIYITKNLFFYATYSKRTI